MQYGAQEHKAFESKPQKSESPEAACLLKLEKWREAEEQPGRAFVPCRSDFGVLLQAVCNAILRASPDNEKDPPPKPCVTDGEWQ